MNATQELPRGRFSTGSPPGTRHETSRASICSIDSTVARPRATKHLNMTPFRTSTGRESRCRAACFPRHSTMPVAMQLYLAAPTPQVTTHRKHQHPSARVGLRENRRARCNGRHRGSVRPLPWRTGGAATLHYSVHYTTLTAFPLPLPAAPGLACLRLEITRTVP